MSVVPPVWTVTVLSFRTSLRGIRTLALAAFAAVPTLILLALVAARSAPGVLGNEAQTLFLILTLPVVVIVVMLILAVAQFRNEIDDDTLTYLASRSIPRGGIVVGKYLGSVAAASLLLVPAALAPVALAVAAGAAAPPAGVVGALVAMTVLACVAYGALFLLLGLLTSWALLYGLLLGFLWEELLRRLPGSVPHLTIAFYLRSLAADLVTAGPLSGFPTAVPTFDAVAGPVLAAVVFLAVAVAAIRYVELVPERTSA